MLEVVLPLAGYLVVLCVGVFVGLVLGAYFARDDLRAARALTDSSGPSANDGETVPAPVPAPAHVEGR
jgi:hypothetical protein